METVHQQPPFLLPAKASQNTFKQVSPSNNISQYSTSSCRARGGTAVASCVGCVQKVQQTGGFCQQQQQLVNAIEEGPIEMTAILHSQPQLQLVSCHGPIMHPSTPSNQR